VGSSTKEKTLKSSDDPWRTFRGVDFRGTGMLSLILVGYVLGSLSERRQPIKFLWQCVDEHLLSRA